MSRVFRVLAAASLLATASGAFAHAHLQAAEPASGAAVPAPPTVKLHFNEAVEPAVSVVKVFGPGNLAIETGKTTGAEGDDKTLVTPLPKLQAGEYRLEWSTMGHDGHRMKGDMHFSVK